MSAITWGVGKDRRATVFCNHCRAVFDQDIPLDQAITASKRAEVKHHCMPPKPWRPGPYQAP